MKRRETTSAEASRALQVTSDEQVRFQDGEVVWGAFHTLAELRAAMAREEFVPGGLKAWAETERAGFVARYLL